MSNISRLSGIVPFYRVDLINTKNLSNLAFRLRIAYISLSGWDKRYSSSYGVVKVTDSSIADLLNISKASISAARKELLKEGFIEVVDRKVIVSGFDRYSNTRVAGSRCKEGLEVWNIEEDVRINEFEVQSTKLDSTDNAVVEGQTVSKDLVSFSVGTFKESSSKDITQSDGDSYDERGHLRTSLEEPCFCDSGRLFKYCCYDAVNAALVGAEKYERVD